MTAVQQFNIEHGAILIPRSYDAEHLRTIHRELFKNVYEWAGEYRSVDMFKPPLEFAQPEDIGRYRPVSDSFVPVFERLAVPHVRERTRDAGYTDHA